eukprot:436143_1
MSLLICFVLILVDLIDGYYQPWAEHFEYNVALDPDGMFWLYWTTNQTSCKIEMGLEVKTNGYIAIGISESGGMTSSDIVLGWVDSDTSNVYLQHRYALIRSTPILFQNQSGVQLINGWKIDDGEITTYLHFQKDLFPVSEYTQQVEIGTTHLIYAWNDIHPPPQGTPIIHCFQCRGIKRHNLLNQPPTINLPPDVNIFDVIGGNITLPQSNSDFCTLIEMPLLEDINHVIRIDPITPIEIIAFVYKIMVYYCPEQFINKTQIGHSFRCSNELMAQQECLNGAIFAEWSVGEEAFWFPENVGLEIGGLGQESVHYVLLQTYYDNPFDNLEQSKSAGLRLFFTPTLRAMSAGILKIGVQQSSNSLYIPPGMDSVVNIGYCFESCLKSGVSNQGITAFANRLNMNLLGSAIKLKHVRNGEELKPLDINAAFSFDFATINVFGEQIKILPGDELMVECRFNSLEKEEMTYFGSTLLDERCVSYLYVYPKPEVAYCVSTFLSEELESFETSAIQSGYLNPNTGFYNVSVDGAIKSYTDFQTDITKWKYRMQYCADFSYDFTSPVEIVDIAFSGFNVSYYYECAEETMDNDVFQWDVWYIYTGGIVIVLLFITFIVWGCKRKLRQNQLLQILPADQPLHEYGAADNNQQEGQNEGANTEFH